MNSQISFDEYLLLCQKSFLYEAQHNPEIVYAYELENLSPNDIDYEKRAPEHIIQKDEFKKYCQNNYENQVQTRLLNKQWFKKVDALEEFTNYWSYGRGLGSMPSHNIYVPVAQTIMPRPKFSDYSKEDQEGKDFTFRTRDSHTPSVMTQPSSLAPSPFSPSLPLRDHSVYAHNNYEVPKHKFNQPFRLNKNKRTKISSVNIPMRWKFSTLVSRISALEEEKLVDDFNVFGALYTYSSLMSKFRK